MELAYQHLWIREDDSKITDPWEISERICNMWLKMKPKTVQGM